jgi:hypothetical protein
MKSRDGRREGGRALGSGARVGPVATEGHAAWGHHEAQRHERRKAPAEGTDGAAQRRRSTLKAEARTQAMSSPRAPTSLVRAAAERARAPSEELVASAQGPRRGRRAGAASGPEQRHEAQLHTRKAPVEGTDGAAQRRRSTLKAEARTQAMSSPRAPTSLVRAAAERARAPSETFFVFRAEALQRERESWSRRPRGHGGDAARGRPAPQSSVTRPSATRGKRQHGRRCTEKEDHAEGQGEHADGRQAQPRGPNFPCEGGGREGTRALRRAALPRRIARPPFSRRVPAALGC